MPLAAALPAIATLVGTGLSIAGNAEDQSAMNSARANEVNQQAQLQKQANAAFQNSLAQSTPNTAQQQMQQGAAARTNAWANLQDATAPVASALPDTSGSGTSNSPTNSAKQRASVSGNAWNTLTAKAGATEGGYGDWENQQAIKNANASQQLGVINNFSQGDAALLPTELQVASQKGDALGGWGSIVSSLGNLAGIANQAGTFGNGTTASNNAAALSEYNGVGSPGMTGAPIGNGAGFYDSPPTSVWANLYA
jgi:hypothetical protein